MPKQQTERLQNYGLYWGKRKKPQNIIPEDLDIAVDWDFDALDSIGDLGVPVHHYDESYS